MALLGKYFTVCLVALLAMSGILVAHTALAQTGVTTPSSPSFGVSYEFFPNRIPPTYGVDPTTGKAVLTREGYTVYSESAYLSIMNQPFEPYKDSNGNSMQLYYNIRWKEVSNNWVYLSPNARMTQSSDSDRILVSFDFKDSYSKSGWGILDIPMGTETEFQVQAMIGYFTSDNVFVGKTSDWAPPQCVQHATIPEDLNSPIPTENPTPSPSPTDSLPNNGTTSPNTNLELTMTLTWIIIGVLVISVISLLLYVRHLKRSIKTAYNIMN